MEELKSEYVSYAITYRCHKKKDADERDLMEYMAYLITKGAIIEELYFEKDNETTYKGLHAHGIIKLTKRFYRKKLMKEGYHLKLEELYDIEGWRKYIKKSQDKIQVNVHADYEPTEEDYEDLSNYIEEYKENIFNDLKKKKLSKNIVECPDDVTQATSDSRNSNISRVCTEKD